MYVWVHKIASKCTCKKHLYIAVASKEIGLEINVKKTKYMVMSRDQNAGRCHSVRTDNSSFERVEHFRYLGTNLTNQIYIQEGNKCRLKSGNTCCCSVQNICLPVFYPKFKIKLYRMTVFNFFCVGMKLGQNKKKYITAPTVNALWNLLHL